MSEPLAARLRALLQGVVDDFAPVMRTVRLHPFERVSGLLAVGFPDWYFTQKAITDDQRGSQIRLLRRYERFEEVMRVLTQNVPKAVADAWTKANKDLRVWLELDGRNYRLTGNPEENERRFREGAAKVEKVVSVLAASGETGVFVVPDTNSMVWQPDPAKYGQIAGCDAFTFVVLPTVLGELDDLKTNERKNESVRAKARAAVSRIAGWMNQATRHGETLSDGVTVNKSITIIAPHAEPNMRATLSWLDAAVPDDRLVASVLALEAEHPGARVVLVTGDINLRNKAGAALIETADVPDPE